jgi:hypothetical protein
MKVKDKDINEFVNVCHKDCVSGNRQCYWPRSDPGIFVQGQGYRSRGSKVSHDYICGTRAIHGCPDEYC